MFRRGVLACLLVLIAGCTSFYPKFDQPLVSVKAFRLLPAQSVNPQFVIDLHIVNPNNRSLKLNGLVYTASIEGYPILSGVSKQLPEVAAYGEADVSLTATPDLLAGVRLFTDLMSKQRSGLKYELSMKLDVGEFLPSIYLTEHGEIALAPTSRSM